MMTLKSMAMVAGLAFVASAATAEYSFGVLNSTTSKVTRMVVSEDGENWGEFNLGGGIAPGATARIVWSSETDDSGCEWVFIATFADGSESGEVAFDFCQEDLTIELSE